MLNVGGMTRRGSSARIPAFVPVTLHAFLKHGLNYRRRHCSVSNNTFVSVADRTLEVGLLAQSVGTEAVHGRGVPWLGCKGCAEWRRRHGVSAWFWDRCSNGTLGRGLLGGVSCHHRKENGRRRKHRGRFEFGARGRCNWLSGVIVLLETLRPNLPGTVSTLLIRGGVVSPCHGVDDCACLPWTAELDGACDDLDLALLLREVSEGQWIEETAFTEGEVLPRIDCAPEGVVDENACEVEHLEPGRHLERGFFAAERLLEGQNRLVVHLLNVAVGNCDPLRYSVGDAS